MCGIVGYIGKSDALKIVLDGLKKVEYRGYDSVGVAFEQKSQKIIQIIKNIGTIKEIEPQLNNIQANKAIGHTRWATHGPPCKENAHPHLDCTKKIAIVHNGIIENYLELKKDLEKLGHKFESQTDSEIIAHLIEEELKKTKNTFEALEKIIKKIQGTYAIALIVVDEDYIYLAKKYAPLIIGLGKDGMFFASDIPAILKYTKEFVVLEDGDICKISQNKIIIKDSSNKEVKRKSIIINWNEQMAQKEGYEHFMLKEIFEQKQSCLNALGSDINQALKLIEKSNNIAIIGCGSSYYASLLFSYLMKNTTKKVASYISSEYDEWSKKDEDLIIAISQSGETADTLKIVREAKQRGTKIVGISNVITSSLVMLSDASINIGAGPEISVVATKSFSAQLVVLYKLYYKLTKNEQKLIELQNHLKDLDKFIEQKNKEIQAIAKELKNSKDFLFLSKGLGYICALEGALKLKEITYLHAEAYPSGELKHGPISMIENQMPIIMIGPSYLDTNKLKNSIKECKTRGGKIIALSDNKEILDETDIKIRMPSNLNEQFLIHYIIPLQLLAYYIAIELNKNPDRPRNLAKSVTVE
jgi:glucosamine--fructose-6-phosphate aminotransferase (isomerizing)